MSMLWGISFSSWCWHDLMDCECLPLGRDPLSLENQDSALIDKNLLRPACSLPNSLFILEKAMAPHSSTLAWKIPWTEEPGGLQSMGSLRVGHNWAASLSLFIFMYWRRKWQPTPVFLPGESQGRWSLVGYRFYLTWDQIQISKRTQQIVEARTWTSNKRVCFWRVCSDLVSPTLGTNQCDQVYR